MTTKSKESKVVTSKDKPARDARGRLLPGNTANPGGMKPYTEEQKIVKNATKKLLKKYEQMIGSELPNLSPILVKQAKKGNMQAFDQIHKILGAYKKEGNNTIIPIQINFKDEDL